MVTSHPEPVDVKAAVERLRDIESRWAEATYLFSRGYKDNFFKPDTTKRQVSSDLRAALSLIDRLQADNERMVEERDIWRTACNQISNRMIRPHSRAEIMDIVRSAEDRQRLQCSGGGDPT